MGPDSGRRRVLPGAPAWPATPTRRVFCVEPRQHRRLVEEEHRSSLKHPRDPWHVTSLPSGLVSLPVTMCEWQGGDKDKNTPRSLPQPQAWPCPQPPLGMGTSGLPSEGPRGQGPRVRLWSSVPGPQELLCLKAPHFSFSHPQLPPHQPGSDRIPGPGT